MKAGSAELMRWLVMPCLVAASMAVAAAGCSSSGSSPSTPSALSSPSYTRILERLSSEETTAQQRLGAAFRAKSVAALRRALRDFESAQADIAQQLASLMPPANAVDANTSLTQAFSDSASAIHSLLGRTAHSRSVRHAFDVVQSDEATQRVSQEVRAALVQLRGLGYLPQ